MDLCILALIAEEPRYGYEIITRMQDRGLVLVGEGSIYPLLSRLQRAGYVEGYMVPSREGPRRKYYRVTFDGEKKFAEWRTEWEQFSRSVDRVVTGKEKY